MASVHGEGGIRAARSVLYMANRSLQLHRRCRTIEGIYSNLSLMALYSCIELAAESRKKKVSKVDKSMIGMLLTKLLAGSLQGSALTGMITCLSQSPRNGEESYLSLKYGETMSKLLNKGKLQPPRPIEQELATARRKHTQAAAVVARGVAGKYQAMRQTQVLAYSHQMGLLEGLLAAARREKE
jgi:hypothetical protein